MAISKTTSWSVLLLLLASSSAWAAKKDTCFECHMVVKGPSQIFKDDVHYENGISCVDCHGGDPNDEGDSSMSAARGFKPRITRDAVPDFCGTCHSDAAFMRKYKPGQRVDQLALYRKSGHGLQFAHGNTETALCIDCHTTHNIRAVNDPQSAVSPSRLAETCRFCHEAVFKESTHAKVFAIKDMAACSVCHSSHGPE